MVEVKSSHLFIGFIIFCILIYLLYKAGSANYKMHQLLKKHKIKLNEESEKECMNGNSNSQSPEEKEETEDDGFKKFELNDKIKSIAKKGIKATAYSNGLEELPKFLDA